MEKYKHEYHNSGRKTGIEKHIDDLELLLPTLSKKEQKSLLEMKKILILKNDYNKEHGILTNGDITQLIEDCKNARFVEENGKKVKYTEKRRREEINAL